MAAKKREVLVIGGTGYLGGFVVKASTRLGHPTFVLLRESTAADPAKKQVLEEFKSIAVNLIYGDIYDHDSLVKAVKQVDVVISTMGFAQVADQTKILAAIKEAGHIKRFIPSDFGNDVDRSFAVEPAKSGFEAKAKFRREVEASGVPYTFVSCNFWAGYFLPNLGQAAVMGLPTDKVEMWGDGNTKAIFVTEEDVGTYTIKAVDDERTLNKILYIRPPENTLSQNELVSLYENLTGKTLRRVYMSEQEVLNQIPGSPFPLSLTQAILHATFIKGDHTHFAIEPSFGVEACELYPDVNYTTVEEYLRRLL